MVGIYKRHDRGERNNLNPKYVRVVEGLRSRHRSQKTEGW